MSVKFFADIFYFGCNKINAPLVFIIEAVDETAGCQYFIRIPLVYPKYGHKKQTRVNFSIKIRF